MGNQRCEGTDCSQEVNNRAPEPTCGFSLIPSARADSEARSMGSQLQLHTEWEEAPQSASPGARLNDLVCNGSVRNATASAAPSDRLDGLHDPGCSHWPDGGFGHRSGSGRNSGVWDGEASGPVCAGESDESLLKRLNEGEQGAMGELWDRYSGLLFSQALRVLHNPSEAEDVVAEVFSEVWRRASGYHPERARPAAWLVTLVRRRAIDRFRERRSHERAEERMALEPNPGPGCGCAHQEHLRLTELRRVLDQALNRLPERQREAVCMVYFEGLTQREISKKTRTPIGTIKTRLELGLRKMRERIRGARPRPSLDVSTGEECFCEAAEAWAGSRGDNGRESQH